MVSNARRLSKPTAVRSTTIVAMTEKKNPRVDIAPIILQAFRAQSGITMARLAERGFEDFTCAFAAVLPHFDAAGTRSTVLAQRAGVTKQAMSQMVREMENRKYVEQVPDKTDTRAKVVRLTKRGVAVKDVCVEVRRELTKTAARALGANDLAKFQADLIKIVAAFAPAQK